MSQLRHPSGHVCVVLLTGLGDVVHGLPLVNALRDDDPRRRITWVVEPPGAGLLQGHPAVDRVVVYHKRDGVRGVRRLAGELKAGEKVDLTLNLNVYLKSAWPTLLSRAPQRVGFERGRAADGVWLASNHHLPRRPRQHTADMFLEFADYLGLPLPAPAWRIRFDAAEQAEQAAFFARLQGRPVVTLVPTSANAKKDWLPERWAQVADALHHDLGYRVVLAGGPGEREQRVARDITACASYPPLWALGDSVRRLAWIVAGSALVVAPDTAAVHLARACEVPVVGLYGHTNPWRVGPWRAYHDLWVDEYTPAGSPPDPSNFTPRLGQMEVIRVRQVLERVEHARSTYPRAAG